MIDKAPSRNPLRSPRRSGWRGSGLRTDLLEQTVNEYLAALEALFRSPTDEAARAWWTSEGYSPPTHSTVPLETIHKARLQWLDATNDMLAESRAFLFEHGYGAFPTSARTLQGVGTPSERSAACRLKSKPLDAPVKAKASTRG